MIKIAPFKDQKQMSPSTVLTVNITSLKKERKHLFSLQTTKIEQLNYYKKTV